MSKQASDFKGMVILAALLTPVLGGARKQGKIALKGNWMIGAG